MIDLEWVKARREKRQFTTQNRSRTKRPTIKALAKAWHCPEDKLSALVLDLAKEKGLL